MMHSKSTKPSRRGNSFAMACIAMFLAAVAIPFGCLGEELAATIGIESQEVFLGEPFAFQVKVSGTETPGRPDLSGLSDFVVRDLGASRSGESSFTVVVNGRRIQNTSTSDTIFNYELTARKDGILTIPPITVTDQSKVARTQPVQIKVSRPVETDDFKLRLTLSKTRCYVGEPVIMKLVWYIGVKVGNYQLSIPVLENDAFTFADPTDGQAATVQTGGGTVSAVQGRSSLDGRQYDAVEFSKILIPKKAGSFEIPSATIACAALAGHQKQKSPFGDDFPFQDAFFNTTREVYKKVIVPSESAVLEVIPVPVAGKPSNFAGHIGEYKIAASATPLDVSVGDPITLTVVLSGPEYLEKVELPPLGEQPALARDFKIANE
ncbi:MAG: BatD family protein, partial [bacterium]